MSSLIFNRLSLLEDINRVQKNVVDMQREYFKSLGIPKPTLLDGLVASSVGKQKPASLAVHQNIVNNLLSSSPAPWGSHGIFLNIKEFESKHSFVLRAVSEGMGSALTDPNVSMKKLNDISLYAESATTQMAIKFFYLFKNHALDGYCALPAMTSPVTHAVKVLFGSDYQTLLEAKTLMTKLAYECEISEMEINTGLWCLGMKMLGEEY